MDEKFLHIDGILVRQEIANSHFMCDLLKCKGACCTFESKYGAPLTKEEVIKIEGLLDDVKEYLPADHWKEIERSGFYENNNGELLTKSKDNRACVFVCYENGIAKCSLEKAYLDGKTDFKKPISCHLFPIRVSNLGGDILKYEKLDECGPAIENGKQNNKSIAQFCEEPLNRLYGKKWYSKLTEAIER